MFRLVALSLPLVLFGIVELALRYSGFGGYPAMMHKVGKTKEGDLVVADQGGGSSWFFANAHFGSTEQQTFLDPKPSNTFRIFLVGESAAQGYPQPRQLSSSAFLQEMLQDAWPDRRVEVINLGTTAVASFPVLGIMNEALEFQPDLIVIYTGNNEFFGTYGVASHGRAGSKPWMLKANRFLYSLAVVQGLTQLLSSEKPSLDRTLMESMIGQAYIGAEDWQREAAANNLRHNVSEMLERCRARGVPALVCTLPGNERDLAPIGDDRLDDLPAKTQDEIKAFLAAAELNLRQNNPEAADTALQAILTRHPNHARAHYLLGKTLMIQSKTGAALGAFTRALDLDSMPWRPPSLVQAAVRNAAHEQKVPVCDLLQAFRNASPGGLIGWELMDDHVHPSLRGQALIAESIVNSLTNFDGSLHVSAAARAQLPAWTEYSQQLGENIYDRFRVATAVGKLFSAPFMRANNPEAFERFRALATGIEDQMPAEVQAVMQEWGTTLPFEGARCPITAAVAQLKLKQKRYEEARELFQIARRDVPQYTSWQLEYTYFLLLCQQKLNGSLSATDRQMAQQTTEQGHFLSQHFSAGNDFTERYTGLIHFLCGEYVEAATFLQLSQKKSTGFDLFAVNQALVVSYLSTQQADKALEILTSGASGGGEFAPRYQSLLQNLPALEAAAIAANAARNTNIPAQHGN